MDRIINPQSYAHPFEYTMKKVFSCEQGGACGMANADFIRYNPFTAVVATCMYIYANASEDKRNKIEEFLKDARFHFQFNFDTLLAAEGNRINLPHGTYELSYENGEKTIKTLLEKFRAICN